MKEKLFVYGTLMKKHVRAIDLIGEEEMHFVGYGKIEGELFDLGEYPGAVERKGKYVYGEVYEIADSDNVLRKLDEYEEFDRKNPKHSRFLRRLAEVEMKDGTKVSASVYFYNGSTKDLKAIAGGRWKKSTYKLTCDISRAFRSGRKRISSKLNNDHINQNNFNAHCH